MHTREMNFRGGVEAASFHGATSPVGSFVASAFQLAGDIVAENGSERIGKDFLTTLRYTAHTDSLAYQFEALKHLAIANSAGLAFCAAVMASNVAGAHGLAVAVAARLCAWGLFIAVVLLVWRWVWGTQQATRMLDLCLVAETRPVTRAEVADLRLSKRAKRIAYSFAVLSLMFFLVAVLVASNAVQR